MSCSGLSDITESGSRETAYEIARLGAGQSVMSPELGEGISNTQLRLTSNCKRREIITKCEYRPKAVYTPRLLSSKNNSTARLLRLSRWKPKTFVDLITALTEINYHRHNTENPAKSNFWFCGVGEELTTHILCQGKTNPKNTLH